jgi:hypothetical protein
LRAADGEGRRRKETGSGATTTMRFARRHRDEKGPYPLLAIPSTMYILAPRINPTWRSNMATKKKAAKKKATKKKAAKKAAKKK